MGCGNQKNRRNLYRISARNVKQHVLSVNKPFYDCVKKDDFSIKLQNYLEFRASFCLALCVIQYCADFCIKLRCKISIYIAYIRKQFNRI